jgi:hypothetical protein
MNIFIFFTTDLPVGRQEHRGHGDSYSPQKHGEHRVLKLIVNLGIF